jgi:hypothetical protein
MSSYACVVASLLLLGACSRAAPESKATPPEPAAATMPPALAVPGAPFVVRIHRFGGGPASLNHTLEVFADGTARLTGYDYLWCRNAGRTAPLTRKDVDTRVTLERAAFDEVRTLAAHPDVTGFAGATGPARAPQSDGVAAEVFLRSRPVILVDGLGEARGKMTRLLDLDRELAARYGTVAACDS